MPARDVAGGGLADQEYLWAAYAPLIYSTCRRYLRRSADVEDAAQETFLRLLRNRGAISGSVVGWVAAAARSCCIDLIRRATRERRRRRQIAGLSPSADDALRRDAIRTRLHDALLLVDENARQLLVQRYFRNDPL